MKTIITHDRDSLVAALKRVQAVTDQDCTVRLVDDSLDASRMITTYNFPWPDLAVEARFHSDKALADKKRPSLKQMMTDRRHKRIGKLIKKVSRMPQYIFRS